MMQNSKIFHCVVDDTALTTNLDEIAHWVRTGQATLVVPLYSKIAAFENEMGWN